MTRTIILRWDRADMDILSRVKNMGEELWGALSRQGLGETSISEIDVARNSFSVRVSKRMLGPATDLIRKQLKKHHLCEVVRIET